jgi:hypothetical protein
MTDKIETPVAEAAASTVEKLWAQPAREFKMPTAAEYLVAMNAGGDTFANVNAAYKAAVRKQQSALQAAAGDILTSDTPGLLPVPVLGPLFQDLNFVRPVVSAFGARAMPNTPSKTFVRPTITTHTSAATQTEGSAVSATTMVIASNTVTKTTVAGQVTITLQPTHLFQVRLHQARHGQLQQATQHRSLTRFMMQRVRSLKTATISQHICVYRLTCGKNLAHS